MIGKGQTLADRARNVRGRMLIGEGLTLTDHGGAA